MWTKIKPFLGALLILLSLKGTYHLLADTGQPRGQDLEAIGTIVSLEEKRHRVAALVTKTDHYMRYTFPAADGQTYSKRYSISPQEFTALREGQRVRVRYHSSNPSINAIVGFRHYISVQDVSFSPVSRMGTSLGIFLIGAFLLWSGLGGSLSSLPTPTLSARTGGGTRQTPANIPANRLTAVRHGRSPRARGA